MESSRFFIGTRVQSPGYFDPFKINIKFITLIHLNQEM